MRLLNKTILFLLVICLSGCFGFEKPRMKKEFTVENYAIPPEFGENKETVLIGLLIGTDAYQGFLERKFEKVYNGKYILLTEDELSSAAYNDLQKYRYVFTFGDGSSFSTGSSVGVSYRKFFVYDRLEEIKYINGSQFNRFAKAIEVYLENLENKRVNAL